MKLDHIDTTILSELTSNARASQVELAERVGLSSTAIARRQKVLEEEGLHPGLSGSAGSDALRSFHHRSGAGDAGKPE